MVFRPPAGGGPPRPRTAAAPGRCAAAARRTGPRTPLHPPGAAAPPGWRCGANSDGRVRNSEPLVLRTWASNGPTGPLDWPNSTIMPRGDEAGQALLERGPPHRVVDDLHAPAPGEALHLGFEVLLGVEDHVAGARLPGEARLLLRGDGAQHPRAAAACHLAEQQADATRGGVDQAGVAPLQRIRGAREVVGGHALQHHGRPLPSGTVPRGRDQTGRGDRRPLRVGPLDAASRPPSGPPRHRRRPGRRRAPCPRPPAQGERQLRLVEPRGGSRRRCS